MTILSAVHGPSPLWYATRGAGATTLVLLTASLALGIGEVRRWQPAGTPRFAVASLHRTLSLLALVLLVVHVVTTVLDPFPKIGLGSALIPFHGAYRPLWIGLGAVALDVLVAVVVTSLVRRRLGFRAWKGVHWAAYAIWPVALLHAVGAGSDLHHGWLQLLGLACVLAVLAAGASRLAAPGTPGSVRAGIAGALGAAAVALAVWLPSGPLGSGWAAKAGTPPSVLHAFGSGSAAAAAAPATPRPVGLDRPFATRLSGHVVQGTSAGGTAVVDLRLHFHRPAHGVVRIRIGGSPASGGGVQLQRSAVWLGPRAHPTRWRGRLEALNGPRLRALVGGPGGRALRLRLWLSIAGGHASGTLTAAPVTPGSGA
jgi:DMSO/TMAO reductase YedYZ heme-binding membrane subunit